MRLHPSASADGRSVMIEVGAQFTRAIVRTPADSFAAGLTTSSLGVPDLALARRQHAAYCSALQRLGLRLVTLPPDASFPDSTFVEDTAVVTEAIAGHAALRDYERMVVSAAENYAANCVRVNGAVLMAAGYPEIARRVAALGLEVLPLQVSEFAKMDGGLSCLSLRLPILCA